MVIASGVLLYERRLRKRRNEGTSLLVRRHPCRSSCLLTHLRSPDATGPTQLGFSKALNAAGFPVSPDLRVEYDPDMKYTTGVWTLPEHVRAKWPVPGGYEIGVILAMTPDAVAGESRAFYLVTMERNQSKPSQLVIPST